MADGGICCLMTSLSLPRRPLKDSERLMEQQGALLKRLAEADSEKAVTAGPLPWLPGLAPPQRPERENGTPALAWL